MRRVQMTRRWIVRRCAIALAIAAAAACGGRDIGAIDSYGGIAETADETASGGNGGVPAVDSVSGGLPGRGGMESGGSTGRGGGPSSGGTVGSGGAPPPPPP